METAASRPLHRARWPASPASCGHCVANGSPGRTAPLPPAAQGGLRAHDAEPAGDTMAGSMLAKIRSLFFSMGPARQSLARVRSPHYRLAGGVRDRRPPPLADLPDADVLRIN